MGKLSPQSTMTSAPPIRSSTLEASSRTARVSTYTSGFSPWSVSAAESTLRSPIRSSVWTICRCRLVRSTVVVVDEGDRAHPGRRQVHRHRGTEAAGAHHGDRCSRAADVDPARRPRPGRDGGDTGGARRPISSEGRWSGQPSSTHWWTPPAHGGDGPVAEPGRAPGPPAPSDCRRRRRRDLGALVGNADPKLCRAPCASEVEHRPVDRGLGDLVGLPHVEQHRRRPGCDAMPRRVTPR